MPIETTADELERLKMSHESRRQRVSLAIAHLRGTFKLRAGTQMVEDATQQAADQHGELEADRDEERRLRLCAENDMHNMSTERDEIRAELEEARRLLRMPRGDRLEALEARIRARVDRYTKLIDARRQDGHRIDMESRRQELRTLLETP